MNSYLKQEIQFAASDICEHEGLHTACRDCQEKIDIVLAVPVFIIEELQKELNQSYVQIESVKALLNHNISTL